MRDSFFFDLIEIASCPTRPMRACGERDARRRRARAHARPPPRHSAAPAPLNARARAAGPRPRRPAAPAPAPRLTLGCPARHGIRAGRGLCPACGCLNKAARRSNAGARAHSERTHAAAADAAAPAPPEPRRRCCACAAGPRETRGLSPPAYTHATRHYTTTHKHDDPRKRTTAAAGSAEDARHPYPPHTPGEKFGERLLQTATTRAAPRRTFPHRRTTRPFTELRRSPRSSPRWPCGRLRAPKPRGYLTDHGSPILSAERLLSGGFISMF